MPRPAGQPAGTGEGHSCSFVPIRGQSFEKRLRAGAQAGGIVGGGELATGAGRRLADGANGARKMQVDTPGGPGTVLASLFNNEHD